MAYLDATVPADSEAVTLGAGRIRTLEADLNNLIEQVWEDTGTFLPGWIAAGAASGGASLFAPGAIQSADVGELATANYAPGSVTNTILATASVSPTNLTSDFIAPAGTVNTASCVAPLVTADSAGQALIAAGALTAAMMGFSFPQIYVGTYTGSNSSSAAITGLPFSPKIVILTGGNYSSNSNDDGNHGIGIALIAEQVSDQSPIHDSWINTAIGTQAGVEWVTNGFTVVPVNFDFNIANRVHTYIAITF